MRQRAALAWLAVVLLAGGYLGLRAAQGLTLQSSLLALLPMSRQDPLAEQARQRVAEAFSRRVVVLLGHEDAARARAAGREFAAALTASGLATNVTATMERGAQEALGALFFPHRAGLLAEADRAALQEGRGQALVQRALGLLYGPAGFGDARLLARDPFLLLPAYLAALPLPQSRLVLEDGQLVAHDAGLTWAFTAAELTGDPFALAVQDRFAAFLDGALPAGVQVLRTGAVFYATAGARQAMGESAAIGGISMVAMVALMLVVFRRQRPMLLGVLAIGVGLLVAFACCLAWFGTLHSVALVFGASLIGIAVDYALQYFAGYFERDAPDARERLRRVLPGIALGLATTLIGYVALLLAPFPGLHQIAAFSVIGLGASFLTVILWYPVLDRGGPLPHGAGMLAAAARHAALWGAPRARQARCALLAVLVLLGLAGLPLLRVQDDVRALQAPPAGLRAQEAAIQRLTGATGGAQFLLVQAADAEAALQAEEALLPGLRQAQQAGQLGGFQAIAQVVPSAARQAGNRALVQRALLAPYLGPYLAQLGLEATPEPLPDAPLLPAMLPTEGPLGLLRALALAEGAHLVLLQEGRDLPALRALAAGAPGVRLVSLAEDWSALFGDYRRQAVWLLALSALLMLPLLAWRYRGATPRVLAPALLAVALAPPIGALAGQEFTFFNAMALVLVFSIGVDYAVFCAETTPARQPVTMLAVALAAISTLLSFGLLALSDVRAVQAFGTTMLLGVGLAVLLAPMAGLRR